MIFRNGLIISDFICSSDSKTLTKLNVEAPPPATNTLEILMELNWVRPSGRKDVPGKPIQYITTDDFLSHFNLKKLSDLPTVDELNIAGLIDTQSIDESIFGTGKFYKEKQEGKKDNIYSNIDEMLNNTLKSEEEN